MKTHENLRKVMKIYSKIMKKVCLFLGFYLTCYFGVIFAGEVEYTGKITAKTLLDTTHTAVGEAIKYPKGQARIVSLLVTVPLGTETGWHTHGVPIFGYVLEGTLKVAYEGQEPKNFPQGTALVDALDIVHNGNPVGDQSVKLLVVFMSSIDARPTIPAEAPKNK